MGSPETPYLQVVKGSRDLLLKFWDPSLSRERLELETSNLACRLITRGTNEKCKSRSKWVVKASRDLLLKFRAPLHIHRMVGARNLKFRTQIDHEGH